MGKLERQGDIKRYQGKTMINKDEQRKLWKKQEMNKFYL